MAAIDFYHLKKEEKNIIFNQISAKLNIHQAAVEKDWWVVQTLALIQQLDVAPYIVFKGGTSLSKAWNIIERFSEDIDLSLDKQFLGVNECTTVKHVKKLRSFTRKYIYSKFIPELQVRFNLAGYPDVNVLLNEEEGENLEPVQISVFYQSYAQHSAYTIPRVKIEIGARSLHEPNTKCEFSSLIGEHFSQSNFADKPIIMSCVNPEKTLLEKLFLLHEEFQKPTDLIRVNRLSRHLYDIERLNNTKYAEIALSSGKLYNDIITHRSIYTKISGIDYNLHKSHTLNPVPPSEVINEWANDYRKMQEEMIYGKSLPFRQLIAQIEKLKQRINNIEL